LGTTICSRKKSKLKLKEIKGKKREHIDEDKLIENIKELKINHAFYKAISW